MWGSPEAKVARTRLWAAFWIAVVLAAVWLPLFDGLRRAFSADSNMATVQEAYAVWYDLLMDLIAAFKLGERF